MCLSAAVLDLCASAVCTACSRDGCTLDITGIHLQIIDVDEYARLTEIEGQIPDFFVFPIEGPLTAVVVELKSGRLDASKAVEQLQAGADLVQALIEGKAANLLPVVLFGRGGQAAEFKILWRRRIRFRGHQYAVVGKRCGSKLVDIIERFV